MLGQQAIRGYWLCHSQEGSVRFLCHALLAACAVVGNWPAAQAPCSLAAQARAWFCEFIEFELRTLVCPEFDSLSSNYELSCGLNAVRYFCATGKESRRLLVPLIIVSKQSFHVGTVLKGKMISPSHVR